MASNLKNAILLVAGVILLCFIIPILFTEQFVLENSTEVMDNAISEEIAYTNNDDNNHHYNNIIKVLFTGENEIREIDIDEYLYGVVSAEMPASYEMEALKAQAVVARTYTLYKIENNANKHGDAAICTDSTCCQAWISKEARLEKWQEDVRNEYWDKIVQSVDSTKGEVITYNGKLINAFFHSNSGGKTELPVNVWGGEGYPYLQTVETSGEEGYSQYQSFAEFTKEELLNKLREKYADIELELNTIEIIERYESGRIKTIRFGNKEIAGVEARSILGLRSANFEFTIENDKIKFTVYGYGHGVGMSQTGADSLAREGKNYNEIIKHFYTGVEIENY